MCAKNKVLCPLVNVPMIDYTLEFLARNGVREVFIFCVSHAKQLEEYLDSSKWGEHMEVRLRVSVRACVRAAGIVSLRRASSEWRR